ncbi:Os03g0292600 [Oryza sativa Japonica Group]|uniref:Os03g0292600 protein n=1 Tax=Oryza sativa subsp. japonica TaxID=39947 RepID=C7IZQ8_ORYSJ|nr:Os03g0292600 [Oryza sativa Japonica Group]|eukprot:NP_001173376.1 Os03g0292600 [Oryza sativa Japonica Group]
MRRQGGVRRGARGGGQGHRAGLRGEVGGGQGRRAGGGDGVPRERDKDLEAAQLALRRGVSRGRRGRGDDEEFAHGAGPRRERRGGGGHGRAW